METEEIEKKIKHLEFLISQIEAGAGREHYFDSLYSLLKKEYQLEGGPSAEYIMGNYRHNLEQTIEKQADTYIYMKRKRPVKGAPNEYRYFISNFEQDVEEELSRWKYILHPPSRE